MNIETGDCENTNTSGELLQVDGFHVESTGGGNAGLFHHEVIGKWLIEILLVDNNLYFPADYPCEAYAMFSLNDSDNEYDQLDSGIMESEEQLDLFISGVREYFNQQLDDNAVIIG